MNGINELITIAKYWEDWADPRLVVLVLHNNDLNQVTWELRAMTDSRKVGRTQSLPDFPYARYAELVGLEGIRVDTPDQLGDAWDRAVAARRPVVIDVLTDPEVPPLPPHVELDQAMSLAKAVMQGDEHSARIVKQGFKGKLQEMINR